MLEAYITNLGRYNEGHLDGEYLKLPATTEEVQALLKRIHVDGIQYEEIFITDYETDIPGLRDCLGEYESIDELNYLVTLLDDLPEWEQTKFAAAVEFGDSTDSVKDLINLIQNLECFDFYPGIRDEDDLGRYYIEEMCTVEVPEHLQNYIDYEAYERDMYHDDNGRFADGGYIVHDGSDLTEHYRDRDDIPDDYRIFAYQELGKSITKALANYRQRISEAPTASHERLSSANTER